MLDCRIWSFLSVFGIHSFCKMAFLFFQLLLGKYEIISNLVRDIIYKFISHQTATLFTIRIGRKMPKNYNSKIIYMLCASSRKRDYFNAKFIYVTTFQGVEWLFKKSYRENHSKFQSISRYLHTEFQRKKSLRWQFTFFM